MWRARGGGASWRAAAGNRKTPRGGAGERNRGAAPEPIAMPLRSLSLVFHAALMVLCIAAGEDRVGGPLASPPPSMQHVIAQGVGCKPPFACIHAVPTRTPKPGLGQVLVRLTSSSVNPSDLDLEESTGRLEGTLGVDFAGVVVKLGAGVKRLKLGDRVWGVTKGAYAEFILAEELVTGLVPAGLRMADAGTIPEVGTTSLQCLQKCGAPWDVKRNVTVVVTSGTGGTGFIGVQLARAFGAGEIITATSGASNIAFAKQLGANRVFDYKVEDVSGKCAKLLLLTNNLQCIVVAEVASY